MTMFVDASNLRETGDREHDICIIGAGAAGIAIAREFIGTRRDVCLVESGGFDLEERCQELYRGEVEGADVGERYLTDTRMRVFGGAMMGWGGLCRPLDAIDFEAKPWCPDYPGWPFGREELIPYYDRAAEVVEIESFFQRLPDRKPFLDAGIGLVALPFHFSPPTFMGATYRAAFEDARNVTVYLHANARELFPAPGRNHITHLHVVTAEQRQLQIKARFFVLCAGGIETPRILLNSDSVVAAGLGNDRDLVGRFFMSHFPVAGFGKVLFVVKDPGTIMRALYGGTTHYLALAEPARRKRRLLSAGFLFQPDAEYGFTGRSGGEMEKVLPQFESFLQSEQLHSRAMSVLAVPEQAPNRESRILLTDERDFTGMRRVRLRFRRSALDRDSLKTSAELVAAELGRHALGRLQTSFTETSEPALKPDQHHMGTTRMHRDPARGVVDPECRIHGSDNLYVAGPSVFPSCGFANPVLTILALALRVADTLKTHA